jgi:hypothetical protein
MRPSRSRHRLLRGLMLVVVATTTTGCLSAARQAVRARAVSLGPTGLSTSDEALRRLLVAGAAEVAADALQVSGRPIATTGPTDLGVLGRSGDELLDALTLSATAFYAGRYGAATDAVATAERRVEQQFTRSITREATALLTNDAARGYRPTRTELAVLPYYATLSFLAAGDLEGAQVEARRLAQRLEESEADAPTEQRSLRAALRLVTAAVFDAVGEHNDAAVARRHVVALTGDSSFAPRDSAVAGRDSMDLLVVVEHGFAPHRIAQTALLGANGRSSGVETITRMIEGSLGADPQGGIFGMGQWRRSGWMWDGRQALGVEGRSAREAMTVAWPVLSRFAESPQAVVRPTATLATTTRSMVTGAIGASLAADYRRALPGLIARVAARTVARRAAFDLVQGKRGERRTMATVLALASGAIELADTRSWSVLPNAISVLPLRVPSDIDRVQVDVGGRVVSVLVPPGAGALRLVHTRLFEGEGTAPLTTATATLAALEMMR